MSGALSLRDLEHHRPDSGGIKTVLARLNCEFAPGQLHVIAGPSGSGKTTLLSLLALAIRAAHGTIMWRGADLGALSVRQASNWRREHVGFVFQTSRLVGVMTVDEHIRLAAAIRRRPDAVDRGYALLSELGMHDKLSRRPSALSGGEKQRVAVAQALCASPSLVLADEPTAALDHPNAMRVTQALKSYASEQGATVVCVSHDQEVIGAADQLVTLLKP